MAMSRESVFPRRFHHHCEVSLPWLDFCFRMIYLKGYRAPLIMLANHIELRTLLGDCCVYDSIPGEGLDDKILILLAF